MSSSSSSSSAAASPQRRSRASSRSSPKPKPYRFKARPAPRTNVKSSFSDLKRIVDTPVGAGLAQVESGFRAVIFDIDDETIGRVVVQVDATLQTVRQLVKMFVKKEIAPFNFLDKDFEVVRRRQEREILARQILHPPMTGKSLPVIRIRYGSDAEHSGVAEDDVRRRGRRKDSEDDSHRPQGNSQEGAESASSGKVQPEG